MHDSESVEKERSVHDLQGSGFSPILKYLFCIAWKMEEEICTISVMNDILTFGKRKYSNNLQNTSEEV